MEISKRFKIIYGTYTGMEKNAVNMISGIISSYVPYILTTACAQGVTDEILKSHHVVLIGTAASNPYIQELIAEGGLTLPTQSEGYTIKVTKSAFHPEYQMIVIAGTDENGVAYGVLDFKSRYLPYAEDNHMHYTYFDPIFTETELPEYEFSSAPAIRHRGLWTWGHVIYDYHKYLENMMMLKMNTLILWNDFLPANIEDVIAYAHDCGIKVICGYAWGWDTLLFGENMDISDPAFLKHTEEEIIRKYEREYSHLNIDGLYFQSFTETEKDEINGQVIADVVVNLVNSVSNRLFEQFGEMELMFGLHATSVSKKLEYIEKTDKRVSILWEDCGAFPYAYMPSRTENWENTLSFTEKITHLRGKEEKFGAVLKGLICLNWQDFEHQMGEFIMGCSEVGYPEKRFREREKIWKYVTSYWLENLSYAQQTIQCIRENTNGNTVLTALVEDGAFEYKIPLPVALMGELLWDSNVSPEELLRRVALTPGIHLQ